MRAGEAVAAALWTGEALLHGAALSWDGDGRLRAISATDRAPTLPGLLSVGFVNAHAHLELSHPGGPVPGGAGSVAWVSALGARGAGPLDPGALARAAAAARAAGCAALIDHSNSALDADPAVAGQVAAAMAAAGLRGVVQAECIGLGPARVEAQLAAAGPPAPAGPGLWRRPTAHSPISCAPALLRAALADAGWAEAGPGLPAPTVHCDEDEADLALLADRAGPWADFHAALARARPGHAWAALLGAAPSGVALLGALGLLGPRLGLVHLTAARAVDLDAVAAAGATAVLCPRSNLHITGRLPPARGLLARGVPLALGTDSLASAPDLDLLAEAATLHKALPDVDPAVWLRALTAGGAALLGPAAPPPLALGAPLPPLLHLPAPDLADPRGGLRALLDGSPWPRRWLALPDMAAA